MADLRENWLDVALAMATVDSPQKDEQRWRRVRRLTGDLPPADWNVLRQFARGVWSWAATTEMAKANLPTELVAHFTELAQADNPRLSLESAKLELAQYLVRAAPTLRAGSDDRNLWIETDPAGLHAYTTIQAQRFMAEPKPVRLCDWCSCPFTGRAGTRLCSNSCRVASHHARAEAG